MELMLLAYCILKGIVIALMMFYENMKSMVISPDGDTDFFDIVVGFLKGYTYLLILYFDYILKTSKDLIKEYSFTLKKGKKQMISHRNYKR